MKVYTMQVKASDWPEYADMLSFETDSMDELITLIGLMLKNGHIATVASRLVPDQASPEVVHTMADKMANRMLDVTEMDESSADIVEALAG